MDRALRDRLAHAGQDFLASHCESLEPARRTDLIGQIESLDLDLVASLRKGQGLAAPAAGEMAAVDYVPATDRNRRGEAARAGRGALRKRRVAFALLAGGQASRLRWDGPKGTFPIGPRSDRSLFRVLVEWIKRAGRDYRRTAPLALTTSPTTDAAIRAFFQRHKCFGYSPRLLSFACQASLPALDDAGRLLLAAPDRLFRSPDGHGGAIAALEVNGILEEWDRLGIDVVCTFQVDNPLLQVVDPDFIGRLLLARTPIATKVVLKRDPAEKVGVVANVGGRPAIVEYSEITPEQAGARDPDGQLTYRLGSIAVHAFDLGFLRRELKKPLPLHPARKEIPCVDADGNKVRRNGVKYERFLFDLFPRADGIAVVEALREREYAPLKNAEGNDSPEAVRAALDAEYRRWYREAGIEAPGNGLLELSPLDAIGPEDLEKLSADS